MGRRTAGRWTRLVLAAVVLQAVSCGTEARSGIERERRGDTLFVRNGASVRVDTADLVELVRVGKADGPEELLFDNVNGFVELPDGRLVVADGSGVRVFSAGGDFISRLATVGEGPGEVRYVVGMDVTADGRVLAVDLSTRRIDLYDPDTGESEQWPLHEMLTGYGRTSIVATAEGAVWVGYNPRLPQGGSPLGYPRPLYLRVDTAGGAVDTMYAAERYAAACPTRSSWQWQGGFWEDVRAPYFPKVKWALSRAGVLAVGCPAGYGFDLLQPSGEVLRVSLDRAALLASDEERSAFVDLQTFTRNYSGFFEKWSWEGPLPPERKPAYQRFVWGREGRLWVWPAQPSIREETEARFVRMGAPPVTYRESSAGAFDVFDATGAYVGAVRVPDGMAWLWFPGSADPFIRGDTLWAEWQDSLEIPYLVKYAVRWPAR